MLPPWFSSNVQTWLLLLNIESATSGESNTHLIKLSPIQKDPSGCAGELFLCDVLWCDIFLPLFCQCDYYNVCVLTHVNNDSCLNKSQHTLKKSVWLHILHQTHMEPEIIEAMNCMKIDMFALAGRGFSLRTNDHIQECEDFVSSSPFLIKLVNLKSD